jgi:hypothetical protein
MENHVLYSREVFFEGRQQLVVLRIHSTGEAVDSPVLPANVELSPQKDRGLIILWILNQLIVIAGFLKKIYQETSQRHGTVLCAIVHT